MLGELRLIVWIGRLEIRAFLGGHGISAVGLFRGLFMRDVDLLGGRGINYVGWNGPLP